MSRSSASIVPSGAERLAQLVLEARHLGRRDRRRGSRGCRRRSRRPAPPSATARTAAGSASRPSARRARACAASARSSSEPNCANASSSRYCARSRRRRPATFFIAFVWALPPTRETEMPTLIAGPHARVEEVGLEEDLAVGDRDHVRRDVRGDVAGLGLDDRQRRERAAAELVGELAGALEQARVQVEDVARERLAARRAAQQERHLPVRVGVLREVVVDDERVAARCRGSARPSRSPRTAPST